MFTSCFWLDSEENLRAALCRMGVNGSAVEDVMDKVRNRHYQVVRFPVDSDFAFNCASSCFFFFLCWVVLVIIICGLCYWFGNMQLACTLTFEAIHGLSCDAGINHPNQYFSDSQKTLKVKVHAMMF